MDVLATVEQGMRAAQYSGALLTADAANLNAPDIAGGDTRFAATLRVASGSGEPLGTGDPPRSIEHDMAALAKNSIRFKALAAEAHAILREFRTVAEESRR